MSRTGDGSTAAGPIRSAGTTDRRTPSGGSVAAWIPRATDANPPVDGTSIHPVTTRASTTSR